MASNITWIYSFLKNPHILMPWSLLPILCRAWSWMASFTDLAVYKTSQGAQKSKTEWKMGNLVYLDTIDWISVYISVTIQIGIWKVEQPPQTLYYKKSIIPWSASGKLWYHARALFFLFLSHFIPRRVWLVKDPNPQRRNCIKEYFF